jgi:hypothetical protein
MPITNPTEWDKWIETNQDDYGGACIQVARRAMEILDEEPDSKIDCRALICRADQESGAGGITGFMAGAVASMISRCHSRGEEFRRAWNLTNQIGTEGERANESDGVLNPAIMTLGADMEAEAEPPQGGR